MPVNDGRIKFLFFQQNIKRIGIHYWGQGVLKPTISSGLEHGVYGILKGATDLLDAVIIHN